MLTKLEVKRQLIHILYGLSLAALLLFNVLNKTSLLIWLGLVSLVLFLVAKKVTVPFFSSCLKHLERDAEKVGFRAKGFFFYTLGVVITVFLFDKKIALAAIMILAFGDSISRLVGPYGYLKHPWNSSKFVEGVIVGGAIAALTAAPFVGVIPALVAASVAMSIESLDIKINGLKVDDNLTIPLVSAATIYLLHLVI